MNSRAAFFGIFFLFGFCFSTASYADQKAPELPGLFDDLLKAADSSDADRIEGLIWQHWLDGPDAESSRLMLEISQAMAGGDLAVAVRLSDELVESYPDYAEAWNKRATLNYGLGNYAESVADIRETIVLEPRHFGAISGLGLIFLRTKDFAAALDAFEQVLAISPASMNAQRSAERVRQELESEI